MTEYIVEKGSIDRCCELCVYADENDNGPHCEGCTPGNDHFTPALKELIRCWQCVYWDRDTLRHQANDFRDWNEAECKVLAERDGWNEINRYVEADHYCSYAER